MIRNRRRGKRRGGGEGLNLLSSPFIDTIKPSRDYTYSQGDAEGSFYVYNDTRTDVDFEGLVRDIPAHFPFIRGNRYVHNLLDTTVDITDTSNWATSASGSLDSYDGAGEFTISGFSGASDSVTTPYALSGESITSREFRPVIYLKGEGANVGKDVTILALRESGGSEPGAPFTTHTLTDDWVAVTTTVKTGAASNTGIGLRIQGVASNSASGCKIKYPTIEEVTGQTNQNPSGPVPVDTATGPEIVINGGFDADSNWTKGSGWTIASGIATCDGTNGANLNAQTAAGATSGLVVVGRRYVVTFDVTGYSSGSVRVRVGSGGNGTARSANGTYTEAITATSSTELLFTSSSFSGSIDNVSVKEATTGYEQYATTNGNTVASNVVTEADGLALVPTKFRTITTNRGQTVSFKSKLKIDPWVADTATAVGDYVLPTDWATNYTEQFYFKATAVAGDTKTHATTEPTWPTTIGNTVVDDQVTWTNMGYYTNRGLTYEPAATNEFTYSEDFTNAAWTKVNATITGDDTTAPDGTVTADLLNDDNSTGTGSVAVNRALTVTTTNKQIVACFAKADQLSWVALNTSNFDAAGNGTTWFDLTNGALGTQSGNHGAGIWNLANGWHFCWISFSSTTDVTGVAQIIVCDADNDTTVDLDGTSSIHVWGAMSYEGPENQSYIPTTTGTVTRSTMAGALKYSDANYLDASWAAFVDFSLGVDQADIAATQGLITLNSATASRGLYLDATGRVAAADGTSVPTIADWSEPAHGIVRAALTLSTSDDALKPWAKSANRTLTSGSSAYDDSLNNDGNIIFGGTSLAYPMQIMEFVAIPNGYLTVTTELDVDTA